MTSPFDFFDSLIQREKSFCTKSLIDACREVTTAHNRNTIRKGSCSITYDAAEKRCAYLYRYANIHFELITEYASQLFDSSIVKSILERKGNAKICCIGGGPGTEVLGLITALAKALKVQDANPEKRKNIPQNIDLAPHFAISSIANLDINPGWEQTFQKLIKDLKRRKIKKLPASIIDIDCVTEFIEVDLLQPLPKNVLDVIKDADIISMVRFASVVLKNASFSQATKNLTHLLKPEAILLYIDTCQESVCEIVEGIFKKNLNIVLGPYQEKLLSKFRFKPSEKEVFGIERQLASKFSAIGCIKQTEVSEESMNSSATTLGINHESFCGYQNQENTQYSEVSNLTGNIGSTTQGISHCSYQNQEESIQYSDKCVQTEFCDETEITVENSSHDIENLITALSKLIDVVEKMI